MILLFWLCAGIDNHCYFSQNPNFRKAAVPQNALYTDGSLGHASETWINAFVPSEILQRVEIIWSNYGYSLSNQLHSSFM